MTIMLMNSKRDTWANLRTSAYTDVAFDVPEPEDVEVFYDSSVNDCETVATSALPLLTVNVASREVKVPLIEKRKKLSEGAQATVIKIWEGVVTSVDQNNQVMKVKLQDRAGDTAAHSADISLEWVVEQDMDLVVPGGVFYWTLYKERKRGSIKNSQEIRFRRLPNWTKLQIKKMQDEAQNLAAKLISATRIAD